MFCLVSCDLIEVSFNYMRVLRLQIFTAVIVPVWLVVKAVTVLGWRSFTYQIMVVHAWAFRYAGIGVARPPECLANSGNEDSAAVRRHSACSYQSIKIRLLG